jgi:hypothetical protein
MGALISVGIKQKDGKYKNYTISVSDTPDQYGQNVKMFEEQTAEERNAKAPKKYIGNGKVFWTDGNISVPAKEQKQDSFASSNSSFEESNEDLPF